MLQRLPQQRRLFGIGRLAKIPFQRLQVLQRQFQLVVVGAGAKARAQDVDIPFGVELAQLAHILFDLILQIDVERLRLAIQKNQHQHRDRHQHG